MNKQEIFDTVCEHAAKQGRKSIVEGSCKYRGPDGTKCFIGALIPDDKYYTSLENKVVGSSSVEKVLRSTDIEFDSIFLMDLQNIHDDSRVSYWQKALSNLAEIYELTMPQLDWSKCQ